MSKILLLDLEGVLIETATYPNVHPEAIEVLESARNDFDKTYLWTHCEIRKAHKILRDNKLLGYFNGLIGLYVCENRFRDLLMWIVDGEYNGKSVCIPESPHIKDLSVFEGSPSNKVLINDVEILTDEHRRIISTHMKIALKDLESLEIPIGGYPRERVVQIDSFKGQEGHSLVKPYEEALKKFG